MKVVVNPQVVVEAVGGGFVVLSTQRTEVVQATGDAAEVLTLALAGADVPDRLYDATSELVRLGVLTTPQLTSRRRALRQGAAVGLAVLALPLATAFASDPGPLVYEATSPTAGGVIERCVGDQREVVFTASGSFTVQEGSAAAEIIVIGGGGSGSARGSNEPGEGRGGGGGGGGAVEVASFQILSSSISPTVTVGEGGATPTSLGFGNAGEPSSFNGITAAGGGGGAADGTGGTSGSGSVGGAATTSAGGGGGGAGSTGGDAGGSTGGNGGAGTSITINGGSVSVGGGGGGGAEGPTGTGNGGGGNGGTTPGDPPEPTPGVNGTGGGGGGGFTFSFVNLAGGSGLVVIRFFDDTCAT